MRERASQGARGALVAFFDRNDKHVAWPTSSHPVPVHVKVRPTRRCLARAARAARRLLIDNALRRSSSSATTARSSPPDELTAADPVLAWRSSCRRAARPSLECKRVLGIAQRRGASSLSEEHSRDVGAHLGLTRSGLEPSSETCASENSPSCRQGAWQDGPLECRARLMRLRVIVRVQGHSGDGDLGNSPAERRLPRSRGARAPTPARRPATTANERQSPFGRLRPCRR